MAEYKLGGIYTVQNKDEARQFIGKEGFFSDVYGILINDKFLSNKQKPAVLERISEDDCLPFRNGTSIFQFFRPIIEDEELMTWEELCEWEMKGFGVHSYKGTETWYVPCGYPEKRMKEKVGEDVIIRYHGSNEVMKPTKVIFLKDCRGGKE